MLFVFFLLTNSKRTRLSNSIETIVTGECLSERVHWRDFQSYLINNAKVRSLSEEATGYILSIFDGLALNVG